MKFVYKVTLLVLVFIFNGCVKDLDFEQAKDIELEPAIAFPLLNFSFDGGELRGLDILVENTISETTPLPSIQNELVQEDLDKIVFHFELSNTFDETVTIQFVFFDVNGNITYSLPPLEVMANDEDFVFEEEILILNNPSILNSIQIQSSLTYNGTSFSDGLFSVVARGDFFVSTN